MFHFLKPIPKSSFCSCSFRDAGSSPQPQFWTAPDSGASRKALKIWGRGGRRSDTSKPPLPRSHTLRGPGGGMKTALLEGRGRVRLSQRLPGKGFSPPACLTRGGREDYSEDPRPASADPRAGSTAWAGPSA